VAVLFVDLDHFKNVNDSLGHHVGDGLLRQVAAVLSDAVRGGDTVSRLGGDEFVVVLGGLQGIDELNHIVDQRLVPRLRDVQPVKGSELRVSCSMGIAVYPDDALDADTLLRHADTAMYQAKADGRNSVRFFDADMTLRAQERHVMERDLRLALEQDQLCLHWQPRVCASSERLLGVEGLLRWQHPVRGMVMPDRFIALAEETGLIVPIGAWVIEQACRQVAAWRDAGVRPFGVSVNLSARQLRDDKLIAVVQSSLQRHGIEPGVLELELTESMVMDGAERNLRQLHALRELGASLSIDDFGTGYSSLAYLSRFPIDKLKVDRSFVMNMLADPTRLAITRAIIGLGHTLGLKVVAEGVEEPRMAQLLREAGCNELQGYLFARPMPAAALLAWMAEREEPQHGLLGDASGRAELVEAR
jgi:diguanylate cyclase (GGDEF)-like protein